MNCLSCVCVGGAVVAVMSSASLGFEFRVRWVERVGNTDTVIGPSGLDMSTNPGPRRLRVQAEVFDSSSGEAPSAGLIGWNAGVMDVSQRPGASVNTRTPGRLSPFDFFTLPESNGNPPAPAGDPFVHLTDIDARLGTQSPFWGCDANGNPLPQPFAVTRGRNTFVSIFEITTDANDADASDYSISISGNLTGATQWRWVGEPTPPNCSDPNHPIPGSVTYAPFPTAPVAFSSTLRLIVPTPGTIAIAIGAGPFARRSRSWALNPSARSLSAE